PPRPVALTTPNGGNNAEDPVHERVRAEQQHERRQREARDDERQQAEEDRGDTTDRDCAPVSRQHSHVHVDLPLLLVFRSRRALLDSRAQSPASARRPERCSIFRRSAAHLNAPRAAPFWLGSDTVANERRGSTMPVMADSFRELEASSIFCPRC